MGNGDHPEAAAASAPQVPEARSDKPLSGAETMYPKIGEIAEDVNELAPMAVESLCMNCGKNGLTRLMMTEIPFFRQVIIMSFECEHCGLTNNEIKPGSAVQVLGGIYSLKCTTVDDFQRQVVKSEEAVVRVEELDLEIPKGKGLFTTVEGLLRTALDELRDSQPQRREVAPEVADQVDDFIVRLSMALAGQSFPLNITMDDPTGNSFLENPIAPKADPSMTYKTYPRSKEQQAALGLQQVDYELEGEELEKEKRQAELAKGFQAPKGGDVGRDKSKDSSVVEKEVYQIPTPCPLCGIMGTTKSCLTDIPYFQDIIIMGFDCLDEECGYKTNEVKGAGPVPEKGRKVRLHVKKAGSIQDEPRAFKMDMNRDVVKSNTAGLMIPELDIEVTPGSLGGMYSTVEGLLNLAKEKLFESQASDFSTGDSANDAVKTKWQALENRFAAMIRGEEDFTLEIIDPLAASYIYSPCAPDPEPRLEVIDYERSFDENEELGLNDINVDNYDEVSRRENGFTCAKIQELGLSTVHEEAQTTVISDADLEFQGPYKTFKEHRPNMVFRLGSKGLGYYRDLHRPSANNVLESMRKVQQGGKGAHPNPNAVQENQTQ